MTDIKFTPELLNMCTKLAKTLSISTGVPMQSAFVLLITGAAIAIDLSNEFKNADASLN